MDEAPCCSCGRDVYDAATAIRGEVGKCSFNEESRSANIEVEGLLEEIHIQFLNRLRSDDCGIVDEDIDPEFAIFGKTITGGVDELLGTGWV